MKSIRNIIMLCGVLISTFTACVDTELESVVNIRTTITQSLMRIMPSWVYMGCL